MRGLGLAILFSLCGVVYATAVTGGGIGGGNDVHNIFTCKKNDDCSIWGTCCNGVGYCVNAFRYGWTCKPSTISTGIGGGNNANFANANFHSYKAEENKWDLKAANVHCSIWNADKPLTWRQKYNWAGFCARHGLDVREACGKCLRVTNPESGVNEIVRIVDKCNNGGLFLDDMVFTKLDSARAGIIHGHLTVKYEFVDCDD